MTERTFQDIPEGKLSEADQQPFLIDMDWLGGVTWNDLLQSKRVLLVSEAGTGKTHECKQQAERLCNEGKSAFFIELASLASLDLPSLLDDEENQRLSAWIASQNDEATFFLDSFDELKISLRSFKQALTNLKKAINGQLGRARIVITTRPTPFDEQLAHRLLPVPQTPPPEPSEQTFANIAMRDGLSQQAEDKQTTTPDWRTVALMPLSDAQIMQFASTRGVDNPSALMNDLRKRNAEDFARRPQDLIELCADWRIHKRIGLHRDQVASNVRIKLQPRDDRPEPAELSVDKAIEGASRLALAMQLMRCFTLRHNAASDDIEQEAVLDPRHILSDWSPDERKALLERALFSFASYGRVRFHHRSVIKYLAAERLKALLQSGGMSFQSLRRLLFAKTKGKTIVRPSLRPIAAWLALAETRIFELLRDNEPAVLLREGDPQALTQTQRNQALGAYVKRYGEGGWRGLHVPLIQVHRFASAQLADEINALWQKGIENPDVRETLLSLIEIGRITGCADLAHDTAKDVNAPASERITAISALVALSDSRLEAIAQEVSVGGQQWPDYVVRSVITQLFPYHLSVQQLCQALSWLKENERTGFGDLSYLLPRRISDLELDRQNLEELRDGMVALVSQGLIWNRKWQSFTCDRTHLSEALAATCVRGLALDMSDAWMFVSGLVFRLRDEHHFQGEAYKALFRTLVGLPAKYNQRLFWAEDKLIRPLRDISDPRKRLRIMQFRQPMELHAERDLPWIKKSLGDQMFPSKDRALLLEAAMHLSQSEKKQCGHVSELKLLVNDQPDLCARIDEYLQPSKYAEEYKQWEQEEAEQRELQEQEEAKNRTSWVQFWHEVAEDPETAFSSKHRGNTAWNLWQVMRQNGQDRGASGWDRRFIEEQFGKATADQLRHVLMKTWRNDHPTLASERSENERNTYLLKWRLGLAAIYAEAEDPQWAAKLSDAEAELAARYAPMKLNGLPTWLESLVLAHPDQVDAILGKELSWELQQPRYSSLLQSLDYAADPVAKPFLPRLRRWLDETASATMDMEASKFMERLQQVIAMLLKHADADMCAYLLITAHQRLDDDPTNALNFVWLKTIMQLDPALGVPELERRIQTVQPAQNSEAVKWFGTLFGERDDAIPLADTAFTPDLLLRLLRLAYQHIRKSDDIEYTGIRMHRSDTRDHAQSARNNILNALLDAQGEDAWQAKMAMAADPAMAHFKDRLIALAEENWALEMDSTVFNEAQVIALDKTGEAPSATNEAMLAVLQDRLADLGELLLSDASPKEAWAGITQERVMRREIARELGHRANGVYTVDQEAPTADENRTDIRLRSTVSEHEAIIELKLADNRSARDLRDTIHDQLVKKYMAAETSRSGCLLITLAKNRQWTHPDRGQRIGLAELKALLDDEAKHVEELMGGSVALVVHILELRTTNYKSQVASP